MLALALALSIFLDIPFEATIPSMAFVGGASVCLVENNLKRSGNKNKRRRKYMKKMKRMAAEGACEVSRLFPNAMVGHLGGSSPLHLAK